MSRRKHLIGQKFTMLTVIKEHDVRDNSGNILWECLCDCGKNRIVRGESLTRGSVISCGCYKLNLIKDEDRIGKKFGKLLVIRRLPPQGWQSMWECLCDCGNIVPIRGGNLLSGNSGTCGCGFGHQMSDTLEYKCWAGIKSRCYNPKNKAYQYYGGRGIQMCDEWRDSFESFYKSVGKKPNPSYSLDRIDSNKNYEPGNVKWATPLEQWINRKIRRMSFDHYQNETRKTAIYPKQTLFDSMVYCSLGLASEASEVCGKLKKVIRDNNYEITAEIKNKIIDELGDTLWYISELATSLDVKLEAIANRNLEKLKQRKEKNVIKGSGDSR